MFRAGLGAAEKRVACRPGLGKRWHPPSGSTYYVLTWVGQRVGARKPAWRGRSVLSASD